MKTLLLPLNITLLAVGVLAYAEPPKPQSKPTAIVKPYAEIEGYRKWKRINKSPYFVQSKFAMLCRDTRKEQINEAKNNPHIDTYITVYVNAIGKQAMRATKNVSFPVGSVIIKEKYEIDKTTYKMKPNSPPKLMTVMIKRQKGYSPTTGDWEYLVTKGNGELQARGKIAKCQNCHAKQKNTDYVFRTYREPIRY